MKAYRVSQKNALSELASCDLTPQVDKAPRLSIRIDIWILLSDSETSAATPPGVIQKK